MEEITKLITHYRKKAVGYRTAAKAKEENEDVRHLLTRAAIWEDVAEDLDAWLAAQEIPEGVK
jgi:ABC-type phosphate transport system ATPase subunit